MNGRIWLWTALIVALLAASALVACGDDDDDDEEEDDDAPADDDADDMADPVGECTDESQRLYGNPDGCIAPQQEPASSEQACQSGYNAAAGSSCGEQSFIDLVNCIKDISCDDVDQANADWADCAVTFENAVAAAC
ncbi:hypothetical protein K8I61_17795 [bacterium]|nr:hypothetical protein [bacterium]